MYRSFIGLKKQELKIWDFSKMTSLSGLTVSMAGIACFAGSICIKDAGIEVDSTEDTYTGGVCIGTTSIGVLAVLLLRLLVLKVLVLGIFVPIVLV